MWPRALAQLIELLPHLSRLLPMADRFLQSKTSDTDAAHAALEHAAGQLTASHSGIYRQLNDHSEKLAALAAELHTTQTTLAAIHQSALATQKTTRQLFLLVAIAFPILAILLLVLLLRH